MTEKMNPQNSSSRIQNHWSLFVDTFKWISMQKLNSADTSNLQQQGYFLLLLFVCSSGRFSRYTVWWVSGASSISTTRWQCWITEISLSALFMHSVQLFWTPAENIASVVLNESFQRLEYSIWKTFQKINTNHWWAWSVSEMGGLPSVKAGKKPTHPTLVYLLDFTKSLDAFGSTMMLLIVCYRNSTSEPR